MSDTRKATSRDRLSQSPPTNESSPHDWVCLKCNNLNFSFRKKCNRCKVQSREDNQQLLYADYYYYSQYYAYHQLQTIPRQPAPHQTNHFIEDHHSPKKMYQSEGDLTERVEREDDHLPSVSPLVKRYGSGKAKKNLGNRSLFVWKLFGEQSWSEGELPSIAVPDFSKDLSQTDDQDASYDFISSVQKMII